MPDEFSLKSKRPSQTYNDILHISNSNLGIDGVLRNIYDGAGNALPIKISSSGSSIECGGEEIECSSISAPEFFDTTFNSPTVSFSVVPSLVNSYFGEVSLFDEADSLNGQNCSISSVSSSDIELFADSVNNASLTSFTVDLTSLTIGTNVDPGEAFCFVLLVNPGVYSINSSLSLINAVRFYSATPNDTNFDNGPGIIRYFFVNNSSSSVSTKDVVNTFYAKLEAQNLSHENDIIIP